MDTQIKGNPYGYEEQELLEQEEYDEDEEGEEALEIEQKEVDCPNVMENDETAASTIEEAVFYYNKARGTVQVTQDSDGIWHHLYHPKFSYTPSHALILAIIHRALLDLKIVSDPRVAKSAADWFLESSGRGEPPPFSFLWCVQQVDMEGIIPALRRRAKEVEVSVGKKEPR